LTHELLGRFLPDRRHCDNPAHVLVNYACLGLVSQLLEGVVPEEAQRMREYGQRLDRLPVACRQLSVRVQVLTSPQAQTYCVKTTNDKRPHRALRIEYFRSSCKFEIAVRSCSSREN